MRIVNLETITGMQLWCKIWLLDDCNRIRAKQNLLWKQKRVYKRFLEPTAKPMVNYAENSVDFGTACEELSWNHCTSNGITERASAVLLQHGLDETWWAGSMECYCYLRNGQELLSDCQNTNESFPIDD